MVPIVGINRKDEDKGGAVVKVRIDRIAIFFHPINPTELPTLALTLTLVIELAAKESLNNDDSTPLLLPEYCCC